MMTFNNAMENMHSEIRQAVAAGVMDVRAYHVAKAHVYATAAVACAIAEALTPSAIVAAVNAVVEPDNLRAVLAALDAAEAAAGE